jgi:ABC-type transporter Mla MlaB component
MVQIETVAAGKCRASGSATFASGADDRQATNDAIGTALDDAETLEIDLSGIDDSNSVVLSLLLSWLRHARASGREIVFTNMPPGLTELVRFTGLDGILFAKPRAAQP